jgi:translation initiation factor IF-2
MKRRSRRSRKQRQPRPKRKEPTVAELEQELQTLQDHMREGTLTAAECRKLSNLSRTVRLIQEAVANGVAVTELGELIRGTRSRPVWRPVSRDSVSVRPRARADG